MRGSEADKDAYFHQTFIIKLIFMLYILNIYHRRLRNFVLLARTSWQTRWEYVFHVTSRWYRVLPSKFARDACNPHNPSSKVDVTGAARYGSSSRTIRRRSAPE